MKKKLLMGCAGLLACGLVLVGMFLYLLFHRTPGHYFDSNGTQFYYTVEGQGEPLILIHGSGVNADLNWRRTGITGLLARHFRVIAFDLRGHGRSGAPLDPDQYGIQMVEDVTRLMDHLGIAKAHFAGYSLGGFILLKFASIHPERVQSAAICAAGWKDPEDPSPLPKPNVPPDQQKETKLAQASASSGHGKTLYKRIRQWIEDQLIDENAKKALRQKFAELGVPKKDLERIKAPVFCVAGTRDGLWTLAHDLKANLPSLQLVEIPGATHLTAPFYGQFRESLEQFFLKNRGGLAAGPNHVGDVF